MAWEKRRNCRLYYYRSLRDPVTGKVRKQYLGTGAHAEKEARLDITHRAERTTRRQAEKERRHDDRAIAELVKTVGIEADARVEAALLAAGYYRPQRKPWRKRRARKA